jgi:beta-D-xylosidase 4
MMFIYMSSLAATATATATAAAPPPPPPVAPLTCQSKVLASLNFCNRSLSAADRATDLLARMTLAEKIGQTNMVASAVPRLGMQQYNFGGEALHGLWATCIVDNVTTPTHAPTGKVLCPTQFPAPIHMAASFDRDLWRRMADATSTEARALYRNDKLRHPDSGGFGAPCSRSLEGCLGLSFYAPNINLARDPRWGRIEETPGEDPLLNREYAYEFTKGFQEGVTDGLADGKYLKASVTVKHYVAYNVEVDLENTPAAEWCGSPLNKNGNCSLPNNRHSFNAHVSAQDLTEAYVRPFEGAVEAGAGAIMCSYNAIKYLPKFERETCQSAAFLLLAPPFQTA